MRRHAAAWVLLLALPLGAACAGKGAWPTRERSAGRVDDAIPERVAASRAAGGAAGEEETEERFGFERQQAREAERRRRTRGRADVVEGKGKPPAPAPGQAAPAATTPQRAPEE